MKKTLVVISLLLSMGAYAKPQEAPTCPSVDQVKSITFDDTYSSAGKHYAYYGDLIDLGTPNYWYEAELNLAKPDLQLAQDNLQTIDTLVNGAAKKETFWGYKLWVCRYTSTQNKTQVVTASPIDTGGIFSSANQFSALGALPLN